MRLRHAAWILLLATPARADPPTTAPVDTSAYTLFRPVPDDQQRPFNPDRPSTTTGPFTVDAGHVQVESSFAQYTKNPATRGGDEFAVLPTEFRVGLTHRTELDLTVNPYLYQRTPATGHAGGFGDLQLQAKVNLLGDDGGTLAAAVIPYLTLPTAASSRGLGTGRLQGGVILPVQLTLPADFTLAGEAELDFPRNDADAGTGFDCLHTVILSHPLVGGLTGYAEYVGVTPVGLGHGYQAYVDAGLTYLLTDTVQLDCAVDIGRSRDTAAYTVLAGFAVRL